jgi:hypothetical protein
LTDREISEGPSSRQEAIARILLNIYIPGRILHEIGRLHQAPALWVFDWKTVKHGVVLKLLDFLNLTDLASSNSYGHQQFPCLGNLALKALNVHPLDKRAKGGKFSRFSPLTFYKDIHVY